MSEKRYNGWANWETWNLNLWADNEEPIYRAKQAMLRRIAGFDADDRYVETHVKNFYRGEFPRGTPDMDPGDMDRVDWSEIVSHCIEEAKEYE